jgi:hypothetical protein
LGVASATSIELGHATDTTLARSAAGVVTIEGVEVVTLSRSQTLTNKSLTSPVVTGTLTAGGGVGTNGQVLTADSTAATGIKWAAPAVLPTFSAYANTNQSFSTSTWTKITLGTEEWDTNTNFASSRFTPTVAGYYTIAGRLDLSGLTANTTAYLAVWKNGANYKNLATFTYAFNAIGFAGATTVYLNGSTDYIELYVFANNGTPVLIGAQDATWFNGVGVRS